MLNIWTLLWLAWNFIYLVDSEVNLTGITNYGPCTAPNNKSGLCVHLVNCDYLFELLTARPLEENQDLLRLSQCGIDNTQTSTSRKVLVCCQEDHCKKNPIIESLSHDYIQPGAGTCGSFIKNRILNGTTTQLDEFPWMALIEYKKPGNISNHHCGGSLISSRFVLTAAHCVKGALIPATWVLARVRLGEWDVTTDPDCEISRDGKKDCALPHKDVDVEEAITHELYDPGSHNQLHDIALLYLAETVTFNIFVKPICLPLESALQNTNFQGRIMDVAGWGKTEKAPYSPVKLKTTVKVWPLFECQKAYAKQSYFINDTQLCAGGEENIDTCSGDSGGPLMVMENVGNKDIYFLAGIVSYGTQQCGLRGWPGVYTRVGSYINWIQDKLLSRGIN